MSRESNPAGDPIKLQSRHIIQNLMRKEFSVALVAKCQLRCRLGLERSRPKDPLLGKQA